MSDETEQETRKRRVDHKLETAGWGVIKHDNSKSLSSYRSNAIEECSTLTCPVDYSLVDHGPILALVEVKRLNSLELFLQKVIRRRQHD